MRDLVRQILGSIAQYERAVIRKRMQGGRAEKAAQGGYAGYGSPAFGQMAKNRELVSNDAEQAAIKVMRDLGDQGKSYRDIANELNEQGIKSKRGGTWHAQTVARVLSR